jgi:hypothetical protein
MAHTTTPVVRNQRLWLPKHPVTPSRIQLGSAAWFAWLASARVFSYVGQNPLYRLTVRKEKRRHGWYWYAYLKVDRKLHNAYVGRSPEVTSGRLAQVAHQLQQKVYAATLASTERRNAP